MIWILKVTAVLTVLFAVAGLLRRATAAHRHLVWGVGLAALLAVPFIARAAPWKVSVLPAPTVATPAASDTPASAKPAKTHKPAQAELDVVAPLAAAAPAAAPSAGPSIIESVPAAAQPIAWQRWLLMIWVAGIGVIALRFLLGLGGAWGMRRGARPLNDVAWSADLTRVRREVGVTRPVELLATDAPVMPFTVGLFRPAVLVPAAATDWTPAQRLDVLRHELAHIRRHDGVWHLIGQATCAVYWFHPMVWMAVRRLRAECERACDAIVLAAGTRPSTYAQHLLDVVRRADAAAVPHAVLAMARRSEFEGRLLAILEHSGAPARMTRLGAFGVAAGVVAVALPLAAVVPTVREEVTDTPPVVVTESAPDNTEPADLTRAERRPETAPPQIAGTQARAHAPTMDVAGADVAGLVVEPERDVTSQSRADGPSLTLVLVARINDTDASVRVEIVRALGGQQDTTALNALARALRTDESPAVRRTAAWALGEMDDARAVPPLVEALARDADPQVRHAAADALGEIQSPAAVSGLGAALRAERVPAVRHAIIEALGEIEDARAIPALVPALADSAVEIRVAVVEALGEIEDPAALSALLPALRDPHAAVRAAAAHALGHIEDRRAVPGLLAALDDSDLQVRASVIAALGDIEDPAATARLVGELRHADHRIRELAANALGDIDDARAVDGLLAALRDDASEVVRAAAASALGDIESLRATAGLAAALADPSVVVRREAAEALGDLDDLRSAPPELIRAIGDADARVRYQAIQAAGDIGDPAVVSALLARLTDESVQIRRAAIRALGEIESPEAYRALVAALDSEDPEIRRLAARALGNR